VAEPAARLYYRIERHNPPLLEDSGPNAALGKPPPRDPSPEALRLWQRCVSTQDTLEGARRLARRVRYQLGDFVAVLRVESDAPIVAEAPGGPGHFSLEGDAQELLKRVVSVESARSE
jgi:hypothetical protein